MAFGSLGEERHRCILPPRAVALEAIRGAIPTTGGRAAPRPGGPTMSSAHGVVRYHRSGPTVSFRVEGRGTMTQALPFRRVAGGCLAGGAGLRAVDLGDCNFRG